MKGFQIFRGMTLVFVLSSLSGCTSDDKNKKEPLPDAAPAPIGWSMVIGGVGDETARAIASTKDGGFIVAGSFEASPEDSDDILLVKLDANGQETWRATFGDDLDDVVVEIDQTQDGGYIVIGRAGGFDTPPMDVLLVKTDANGVEQWRTTFDSGGADKGLSVDERPGGGYIVGAHMDILGASEAVVIATDANGVEQWRTSAGPGTMGIEAETLADGTVVLAYWYMLPHDPTTEGQTFVALLKLDANGTQVWRAVLNSDVALEPRAIDVTPDGGFVVCGQIAFMREDSALFLWKMDSAGAVEWRRTYGDSGRDIAHRVRAVPGGGYVISGEISAAGARSNAFLLRTDMHGTLLWQHEYGGAFADVFHDVAPLADGFVAAGTSEFFDEDARHSQIHVVRTFADGTTPAGAGMVAK